MPREQLQRLALVVLVVLLAAVASDRLLAMVLPSCTVDAERIVHVRLHEAPPMPPLPPLPPMPPLPEAHGFAGAQDEMAAEARRMAEEARRMAEEHRRIAEEHRRMAEEHRRTARERVVVVR